MALGFPILVLLIWIIVQLGLVYRATAGIQHALGEGARLATVWPEPDAAAIKAKVEESVYGVRSPGVFTVPDPVDGADCDDSCLDVTVQYSQPTDLLFFPGPTITIERTKRVWTAGED